MENLGNWATYEYTLIKRMRTKTAPPRVAGLPDLIDQLTSNYFNRLNTKLLTANGDIITPSSSACYFWSASEYNSSLAVIIGFNTLNVYLSRNRKTTNNYYYARAVLAY